MIANYHSHTTRCNHAKGTEEEFVRRAIDRGMNIFGFSDHTPQYFSGDYYSFMRMRPEQLEEYCVTVRQLKKKYAGQLEIPLGVEAEYYPGTWKELLPRLRDAGIEYLIMGQHWVGNEQNEPYTGHPTADENLLEWVDKLHFGFNMLTQNKEVKEVSQPELIRWMNASGDPDFAYSQSQRIAFLNRFKEATKKGYTYLAKRKSPKKNVQGGPDSASVIYIDPDLYEEFLS